MSPWNQHTGSETLDNLRPGHSAAVLGVARNGKDGLRLQELGIVPGAQVEVLSSGEPMLIKVGEQRLSLRKVSAEAVSVFPV